jgi:hypothetical protein
MLAHAPSAATNSTAANALFMLPPIKFEVLRKHEHTGSGIYSRLGKIQPKTACRSRCTLVVSLP